MKNTEYAARDVARCLKVVFEEPDKAVATLLRAVDFPKNDVLDAIPNAYGINSKVAKKIVDEVERTLERIGSSLRRPLKPRVKVRVRVRISW